MAHCCKSMWINLRSTITKTCGKHIVEKNIRVLRKCNVAISISLTVNHIGFHNLDDIIQVLHDTHNSYSYTSTI